MVGAFFTTQEDKLQKK